MSIRGTAVAVALIWPSALLAQVQTQGSMTHTLALQEFGQGPGTPWSSPVPGGNGNGIIEPGEGVLFTVSMSMSGSPSGGGLGSPLTWNPAIQFIPPSTGVGTLAGFWGAYLDVVGDNNAPSASGIWSDNSTNYAPSVRRRLITFATIASEIGYVNGVHTSPGPASRVTNIQPLNGPIDAEAINHTASAPEWQGLWIPTSYAPRTVNWDVRIGSLNLLSQVAAMDSNYGGGNTYPIPLNVVTLFGSGQSVQIVPGPGGAAVLGLASMAVLRRRKR